MNWENPSDVLKALLLLYSLQTDSEKLAHSTDELNDAGFNSADAGFCSDIAQNILYKGWGVSSSQYETVRGILRKYKGQIDMFGIEHIQLPETAVVKFSSKISSLTGDGLLRVRDEILEFIPNIYPSNQIKPLGFVWGKNSIKSWTGLLSLDRIYAVQQLFHNSEIGDGIREFLDSKFTQAEISNLTEDSYLFPDQKDAVRFMIKPYQNDGRRRGLLAMAPGCGKTATAIFAATELGGRTLVVCPLSLTRNWKKEIKHWISKESMIWHGEVTDPSGYDWVITNYDTIVGNAVEYDVKYEWKGSKKVKVKYNWRTVYPFGDFFDNLIFDESILIKNRKAQRVDAMRALSQDIKNVWELSGSPASRFLDDMWSQFHILDPKRFSSYWRFADQFCILEKNQWGTAIVGNKDDSHDRIKNLYRDIYFSRTQEEMLNIPDWIFEDIEIQMSDYQENMYNQMESSFIAELPDGDEVLAPNILSQMIRLVQIASNPVLIEGNNDGAKWKVLPEVLEYTTSPHIIWAVHKITVSQISDVLKNLKYKVGILTGDTPEQNRQGIIDGFQSGNLDIIVSHPGVGRFGHTLTRARTAIYLERSYDGDHYYQSLYRIKRIGTTLSPHVVHLIAARKEDYPTIDLVIGRVLKYRKDNALRITSGLIRKAYSGEL